MKLILKEEPKEEIITLEEAKNYLRINHDFDDELIKMFIKSTRCAMEAIIQKSILAQTWEYIIDSDSVCKSKQKRLDIVRCSYGKITIPLPKSPVVDVLSVKMNFKKLKETAYSWDWVKGKCALLTINCKDLDSKNLEYPIKIKYRAGIAEVADNVPYQIKLANLMLLANAYQERYSFSQTTFISQSVKDMLVPFLDLRFF